MFRDSMALLGCGLLIVLSGTLQGCIEAHTADPSLAAGDSVQKMADEDLPDDTVSTLTTNLVDLAQSDCVNTGSLDGVLATLANFLSDFFEEISDEAVCQKMSGMLYVNLTVKKVKVLGGAIQITRSPDDDTRGPIFAMKFPLLGDGSLDPATITNKLLTTTQVHLEGFAKIVAFCSGYVKFLINQMGYKFYLEANAMFVKKLFEVGGMVSVSDKDEIRVNGSLKSWFTADFADEVSQLIRDAAMPFTDSLSTVKADVEKERAKCPDCKKCTSIWNCIGVPFTCAANEVCKATLDLAIDALDLVQKGVGSALEGAAWIVDNLGNVLAKIFTLHEASFSLVVRPDDIYNSCLDLNLDVTIFGTRIMKNLNVCLDDLKNEVMKIARQFAPGIFAEIDKGNAYVVKYRESHDFVVER